MLAQQLYKLTTRMMTMKKWLLQTLQIQQNQSQNKEGDVFASIKMLLLKMDESMFSELKEKQIQQARYQQNFLVYLGYLQRYLCKKELKKLKPDFQVKLRQNKDQNELLKLVLYLGINSSLRKEIVDKIISFQEQEQRFLMNAIKQVERQCEQLIQIKKVIERVMLVQSANQQLKMLWNLNQSSLQTQIAQYNELELENRMLAKQIQIYQKEKEYVVKQRGSNSLKDYSLECCQVKSEIAQIESKLYNLNVQSFSFQENNKLLKKQLKTHGKVIKQYIQQLEKLKSQHKLANQQNMLRQIPQQQNSQTLTLLPLRDLTNKNIFNTNGSKEFRKTDTERTNCSRYDKDQTLVRCQNKCSLGLLLEISQVQKEYQQKLEIVLKLKDVQRMEKQRKKKLSKKLQKLRDEHQKRNNAFERQTIDLLA